MPVVRVRVALVGERSRCLCIYFVLLWWCWWNVGFGESATTTNSVSTCFNLSFVRSAVLDSELVFIGKILNLTELTRPNGDGNGDRSLSSGSARRMFSESLVNPNESQQFHHYHYNHVGAGQGSGPNKRRRHSTSAGAPHDPHASMIRSFTAAVQVKTIFKGQINEKVSLANVSEGQIISVKIHVGDQRMSCLRRLRALDTRIFFYTSKSTSTGSPGRSEIDTLTLGLVQTLMPLPPTLGILSTVRKTVKDEPCQQKYCPHGADCIVEGGRAICRCPESCSSGYDPVCGSDDVTWANACLLKQFACKHQKSVRVKRTGTCSDHPDPCLDKECPFGSRCVVSPNEETATCECPPACPVQLDDIDLENELCASNGKQYHNECEFNRQACLLGQALTVKYFGKCDPCEGIECDGDSICQLDSARRPVCACTEVCQWDLNQPVCASNGRSYTNEGCMRQDACRTKVDLHIIYRGHCSSGVNPCDSVVCNGHEACSINRFGVAQCTCEHLVCEPVVRPVCGSDVKTYDNVCELTLAACREARDLRAAFHGTCESGSRVCTNHTCPPGANCTENAGVPVCDCPHCTTEYDPVCGSNRKSYLSSCELRAEACRTNSEIEISYSGPCDPCANHRCDFYSTCTLEAGSPKCVCQQNCTVNSGAGDTICGSDGQFYTSECELQRESCLHQKVIRVEEISSCDLCWNVQCKFGAECQAGVCKCPTSCPEKYEPVCASNFQTFTNECELQKEACDSEVSLTILFYGNCTDNYAGKVLETGWKCEASSFGCCLDQVTPALGPDNEGCPLPMPLPCNCNRMGSKSQICDPITQECDCFPGIGGPKCNRCLPGFWGFPRKASKSQDGCTPCDCDRIGSDRDDCEQMSGNCVCKPGVTGQKCDKCSENEFLSLDECFSEPRRNLDGLCDQVICDFGAECEVKNSYAECTCKGRCEVEDVSQGPVCGSDGKEYHGSACLRLASCQKQIPIWVSKQGPCEPTSEGLAGFVDPVKGSDSLEALRHLAEDYKLYTGPEVQNSSSSPGMKSTRHLLPQLNFHDSFQRTYYNHRVAMSTIEMKSYLGDSCQSSSECVTTFSVCLQGTCICREGYYEDSERIQCKPTITHAPKPMACIKSACHPVSTCLDHLNGTYSCICPIGRKSSDDGCVREELPLPLFTGKSTIVLGLLGGHHKLSVEVQVTPFLDFQHGILIFASQYSNGTGDFMSLALIDGHVEFRYDLGDGPLKLRSANRLKSGTTYSIAAKRYNRDGLLQIDDEEEVQASSAGFEKSLDLAEEGGYMGHVPLNSTTIWEIVGTSQGFVGCVNSVRVGRRPVEFVPTKDPLINSLRQVYQCVQGSTATWPTTTTTTPSYPFLEVERTKAPKAQQPSRQVSERQIDRPSKLVSPCSAVPCKNGGHCWMDNAQRKGFRCICHPQYSGKLCDTKMEAIEEAGLMLDFRGSSYLQLPQVDKHGRHFSIELWVMVRSENGLLLYSGQAPGKGDFIALHLRDGYVEFLYELGSGVGTVTWAEPLTLNKWHWIYVLRNGREARLQVDGGIPEVAKSPPTLSELNLELPLYVGGIPDINLLHRRLDVFDPFDGVLQYVQVNGMTFHKGIVRALKERLVHKYEGPPCGSSVSSCLNGGTCFPRLGSFACLCSAAFIGETCDKRKDLPGPLRFGGENFVRFPKKAEKRTKVQRQNRLEIVFRTESSAPGVLLWTGQPLHETKRRGHIGLFMSDGYLELRINLGALKNKKSVILRSKTNVSDGRWHQVVIERRRRLIVFQIDGSSPQRATAPVGSNALYSDGRVWIGGVGPGVLPGEVPPKYHQGFIGCVDLVRIDKKRVPLAKIAYATGHPFCIDDD